MPVTLPDYFLQQPPADWSVETIESFDRLYAKAVEHGSGSLIEYTLSSPKWQFLSYLCERKNIVLHGSGNPDIAEFEPRQSNDVNEFGNRKAVYAASDGIWPMYFAIVDRERYITSLVNSAFRIVEDGKPGEPYYFFSVNGDALPYRPWRNGMIYVLPADSFERQERMVHRGAEIELSQWASLVPVKPLARLSVVPEDFPFLEQIQPHDPAVLRERAAADPDGFPWL